MSNMTEYELHSQGACHCLTPAYDGRDPMRNRPLSNGPTMTIQRYGLGREYAGNTGSPAITEQAGGAYVRYEDFQRMEAAHKAHNEMLVLRTKKAEAAAAGTLVNEGTKAGGVLCFDGGSLHVQESGSGHIVVPEDQFTLEDDRCEGPDGPQGSIHWLARIPASEMIALRNFLNVQQQRIVFPSHLRKMWSGGEVQAWLDAYVGSVAQQVSVKGSLERYRQWQAQQDADKVDAQPVGYFQNVNSANGLPPQYEQVSAVAKSDDDVFPLYRAPAAAQPDPAMAGDEWLNALRELVLSYKDSIFNPSGDFLDKRRAAYVAIIDHARQRVQPASGEDCLTDEEIEAEYSAALDQSLRPQDKTTVVRFARRLLAIQRIHLTKNRESPL